MREKVLLICEECLSRNYTVTIKKDGDTKLQMRKFCPHCGKYTIHKISK
ncbi:MAG: 50S ribosomal protein L33 [Erysipelotrichaceae bacterium]|nr:50S ribosomal protein L33 [Erysipelotrichaceae bacterium]